MKSKRQKKILELISEKSIETQEIAERHITKSEHKETTIFFILFSNS